ncbi:MAG TPA: hypothetical protein VKF82_00830 [Candidatus Eremiobacteraceae bacterium]|nr:hypothetical protein [Candidatus Eremiobacteraceae bacterium]
MYYKEIVTVSRALMWLVISLAMILGAVILVSALSPHGHVSVQAGDTPSSGGPTSFVALLGTAALLAGGIMATVLGVPLAKENEGHLELAWTKPYSRTQYATAIALVDSAALIISTLLGFVTLVAILDVVHSPITWGFNTAVSVNIVRFLLFPLAWYGLLNALSASARGGARVQGLVWLIAIVLVVLYALPLPAIWHGIMVALNVVNPLIYVQYHEAEFSLMTGAGSNGLSGLTSGIALAVIAIGGWALAAAQWRRLQA